MIDIYIIIYTMIHPSHIEVEHGPWKTLEAPGRSSRMHFEPGVLGCNLLTEVKTHNKSLAKVVESPPRDHETRPVTRLFLSDGRVVLSGTMSLLLGF